jgi:hypothetical protein
MLSDAVRDTPALKPWADCGWLLLIGGVKLTREKDTVHGAIDINYYVLTKDVTFIAPYSDRRPMQVRIDDGLGGEEQAANLALAILADAVARDAVQKLSSFAHTEGCVAQPAVR